MLGFLGGGGPNEEAKRFSEEHIIRMLQEEAGLSEVEVSRKQLAFNLPDMRNQVAGI